MELMGNMNQLVLCDSEETTAAFYDKAQSQIEEIYNNAMEAALQDSNTILEGKSFMEWIFDGVYYGYRIVADLAPYLIVFSILIGVFVYACSRKNKILRKWALTWLIILIPVALILFRFGVGILFGIFTS